MSVLIRDDKTQFVVQPYRELISLRNPSLVKKEMRFLAQQNGQFVRMFKQLDGRYEAVFSRDPGYLLAETIWQHFDKPNNLLFCEAGSDGKHILVVIVRDRTILFDARVAREDFKDELEVFVESSTDDQQVFVYGNVPLAKEGNADTLVLSESLVASWTQLDEPLFETLQVNNALQLLPLDQAIAEQRLGNTKALTMVSFFVVMAVAGFIFWHVYYPNEVKQEQKTDLYRAFKQALTTPAPSDQLQHVSQAIETLYSMPGWVATRLQVNGNIITATVHSLGGNLAMLREWSLQNNAVLNLTPSGAELILTNHEVNRPAPRSIHSTQKVTETIIDNVMQIIPGDVTHIDQMNSHGVYNTITLNIKLDQLAPTILPLLGQAVSGLPVTLDPSSLSIKRGLVSGVIQLTVLGTSHGVN